MTDDYDKFKAAIDAANEAARKASQDAIDGVFKYFFERNPLVYGVGWKQFAPSFNDGDPCVFSVRAIELYLTEDDAADENDCDGDRPSNHPELVQEFGEAALTNAFSEFKKLVSVIKSIDDSYMANAFGDSAKVLYTKAGPDVDEDFYGDY